MDSGSPVTRPTMVPRPTVGTTLDHPMRGCASLANDREGTHSLSSEPGWAILRTGVTKPELTGLPRKTSTRLNNTGHRPMNGSARTRSALAALIFLWCQTVVPAQVTVIRVESPMTPTPWALLERELLRANAQGVRGVLRPLLRRPRLPRMRRALGRRRRPGRRHRKPQ